MLDVETMRAQCLARFTAIEERHEALTRLIGESYQLSGRMREQAREMLRELKQVLSEEAKRVQRTVDSLDPIERAFYYFAVQEASADLSVSVNTIPGREWLDPLQWSLGDLTFAHSDLAGCSTDQLEALALRMG